MKSNLLKPLTVVVVSWLFLPGVAGYNQNMPPKKYRGDARISVNFTEHAVVLCQIVKAPKGSIACAGVDGGWAIMPNPCNFPEAKIAGTFAFIMCHEKAHSNGWPVDHPK